MIERSLSIVILGSPITSVPDSRHADAWRALMRELTCAGHHVLYLERERPPLRPARRRLGPAEGHIHAYSCLAELKDRFASDVREADLAIATAGVPEGEAACEWLLQTAQGVKVFWDMDTPETLARLSCEDCECPHPGQIPRFDGYLSSSGGPALEWLEKRFGAARALPLYAFVDPECFYPEPQEPAWAHWDLGIMEAYGEDRQLMLERMLIRPALQWPQGLFVLAGPNYPEGIDWPVNVERLADLSPAHHRAFYNRQRFTLNISRPLVVRMGYTPGAQLFQAAACATPIITDYWAGLETFFHINQEIHVAHSPVEILHYLRNVTEEERYATGWRARRRVLAAHTTTHRVRQLLAWIYELQEAHVA